MGAGGTTWADKVANRGGGGGGGGGGCVGALTGALGEPAIRECAWGQFLGCSLKRAGYCGRLWVGADPPGR